jgi:hypothetical protein
VVLQLLKVYPARRNPNHLKTGKYGTQFLNNDVPLIIQVQHIRVLSVEVSFRAGNTAMRCQEDTRPPQLETRSEHCRIGTRDATGDEFGCFTTSSSPSINNDVRIPKDKTSTQTKQDTASLPTHQHPARRRVAGSSEETHPIDHYSEEDWLKIIF